MEGPHQVVRHEQTNLKMNADNKGFVMPVLHYFLIYRELNFHIYFQCIYFNIYQYISNKSKLFL